MNVFTMRNIQKDRNYCPNFKYYYALGLDVSGVGLTFMSDSYSSIVSAFLAIAPLVISVP